MKGGKRKRLEASPDDASPVNPIDQKHLPYGEEKSSPMEEPGEPVSNTQVAVQGDEAREGVEGPKIELPKGFYEVEAIRSKRMRKGRKQYLIKWLGWPESENTWEPLKNLRGVCDLIKAFEKSYKSAKQSKHRGKQVAHETSTEREQYCATPCIPRPLSITGTDNHQQSASRPDVAALTPTVALADEGDNNADVIRWRKGKQPMEVGSTSAADQTADRREEGDYDPKLVELIATSSIRVNGVHADGLTVNAQLTNNPSANCHVDGPSMVDGRKPEQNERPKGAKKRKLGPVRRFIKVPHESDPVEQVGAAVLATGANNEDISQVHMDEHDIDVAEIIKILKRVPLHESDTGELYLIFEALRSNGEITVVSSDYLLESNPKLLARYLMKNSLQDEA